MGKYENGKALCPFYHSAEKRIIRCDGILKNSEYIATEFNTTNKRDDYFHNFCASRCWQGCIYAQMIQESLNE